jgi:protein O-GlcNAc transferase
MNISLHPNHFDIPSELSAAVQHHQAGRFREAEAIYRKILALQPNHPDGLHLLGLLAHQTGNNAAAVNLIAKALQLVPGNPDYCNSLGACFRAQGRFDDALACYRKSLQIQPDYAETHNNMGNVLRDQGRFEEAIAAYQRAVSIKPDFVKAYKNMGLTLKDQGRFDEAATSYRRAAELQPNEAQAYNKIANMLGKQGKTETSLRAASDKLPAAPLPLTPNLEPALFNIEAEIKQAIQYHQAGQTRHAEDIYRKVLAVNPDHAESLHLCAVICHQSGRKDEAVKLVTRAIQLNPGKPAYHNTLGITFQDRGRTEEAIACYQNALKINPNFVEAYGNMAFALMEQRRIVEAIVCYQKALQIRPDDAVICNDMGTALQDAGNVDEAVKYYRKALQINPNYPEALNNLGNALKEQSKTDEAILSYRKALEINPNYTKAYSCLIHELQQTCAWLELAQLSAKLDSLTDQELREGVKTSESPFMNVGRTMDLSRNLAVAKSWAKALAKPMSNLGIHFAFDERKSNPSQKITVAYLSNDFRNHAISHLMLGVFGLHNREEFNVFCYSYGPDDASYYRKRIQQDCDKFVDIRGHSHADAAKCICQNQVDILIELTGHTKDGRLEICALRPAPVQVSYLGFPGTSGADFFDYILTDRIVTPPDHAAFYTEKFACMPHCFQVNDRQQEISDRQWKRSDFGLSEDSFVFCSFNHGYKIEPIMFDTWMKILRQIPKSILWLPKKSETGEKNVRHEAQLRGVAGERICFADKLPTKADYLARIKLADLILDTRVYNGHTTTSDALWAGVPVVTLQGGHYASRVAASVLTAVGLPELVTHTLTEYEQLCVRLASHSDELNAVRKKLDKNRLTSPLFDTPRFVRDLENVYKEMRRIFLSGQKPRAIG